MLALARDAGFSIKPSLGAAGVMLLEKPLCSGRPGADCGEAQAMRAAIAA
jgi:hypothetical protein